MHKKGVSGLWNISYAPSDWQARSYHYPWISMRKCKQFMGLY